MTNTLSLLPKDIDLYGLVGGVPQEYGGVITAALSRISQFADIGDRNLTLLTKSVSTDPVARENELHQSGQLSRKVSLRNPWHDLRVLSDEELLRFAKNAKVASMPQGEFESAIARPSFSGEYLMERNTASNPHDRVVGFREDCSLAFIDEGASAAPEGWSRRITSFLRSGEAIVSWGAATPLYHAWFDSIIGSREAVIINDSSEFGHVMSKYQRDNVLTAQVVHSNYINRMQVDKISAGRFQTMQRLDWFDMVSTLTPGQADDFINYGIVHPTRVTSIPNASRAPLAPPSNLRDPLSGVHVARLAQEKRTSHTVRAVARAHTPETPIEIDIYGDGPLREPLESLSADLRATEYIRFHGYDSRARMRFSDASFSILSSVSEGQSLVILESMAAGCIPIAYDIKYGPSIMIDDGVDGFLVADGDVRMLANRIQRIASMPAEELDSMRSAAMAKAQRFAPERIVSHWGSALASAIRDKRHKRTPEELGLKAELVNATLNESALLLTLAVTTTLTNCQDAMTRLSWISRSSEALGGIEVDSSIVSPEGRIQVEVTLPLADLAEERRTICDIYLDVVSPDFAARTRVSGAALETAVEGETIRLYRTKYGNLSLNLT